MAVSRRPPMLRPIVCPAPPPTPLEPDVVDSIDAFAAELIRALRVAAFTEAFPTFEHVGFNPPRRVGQPPLSATKMSREEPNGSWRTYYQRHPDRPITPPPRRHPWITEDHIAGDRGPHRLGAATPATSADGEGGRGPHRGGRGALHESMNPMLAPPAPHGHYE
jgi:hypothetical protein